MNISKYSITNILIAINIVLYLLCAISSGNFVDIDLETLLDFGAMNGLLVVAKEQWIRVFSAMFLHGGVMHIAMNMISLYIVGRVVEIYFGKVAFLILYITTGLVGAMVSLYIHTNSVGMGASGAIFGIFGAMIGFFVAHKDHLGNRGKEIFNEFGTILALNLFLGLSVSSIDMSAHIGGLIVGLVGGFIIAKYPKALWIYTASIIVLLYIFVGVLESHYVQVYM
jgi:rhomboid protease GluP